MFECTHCGHADYAHTNFVGACIHGQMKPKDGLDCDCPRMDHKPVIRPGQPEPKSPLVHTANCPWVTHDEPCDCGAADRLQARLNEGGSDA